MRKAIHYLQQAHRLYRSPSTAETVAAVMIVLVVLTPVLRGLWDVHQGMREMQGRTRW